MYSTVEAIPFQLLIIASKPVDKADKSPELGTPILILYSVPLNAIKIICFGTANVICLVNKNTTEGLNVNGTVTGI